MVNYISLDIETTGIGPEYSEITEIGGVKIENNQVVDRFSQLVNPMVLIPKKITEITGITDEMVADKPTIDVVLSNFIKFCGQEPIIGHNILFDFSFLKSNGLRYGYEFEKEGIDTLALSRRFAKELPSHKLTDLLKRYNIIRENAHRAYDDALATHELYQEMKRRYLVSRTSQYFIPKVLLWEPKKMEPITKRQKSYLISLMKQNELGGIEIVDKLSKSSASKKIDSIIREYGRS